MNKRITVFISYSWDSPEHQEWVLKLATDLMQKYGINVLLDQFELEAGHELTLFMESSVEKADKVLVIMTPNYQQKADSRQGGVGFEYSMITQALFTTQTKNTKFIPVLREGDPKSSCPTYLKGRIYYDMRNQSAYESILYELSRLLYEKPEKVKPELGPVPDFNSLNVDPLLSQMKYLSTQTAINNELDRKLNSSNGIELAQQEVDKLFKLIQEKAQLYNESAEIDIRFILEQQHNRSLIISSNNHSIVFHWRTQYSNTLDGSHLVRERWAGKPTFRSDAFHFPGKGPKQLSEKEWAYDLDTNGKPVWISGSERIKNEKMAHDTFSYLIDQIRKERSKNFRA